MGSRPPLASSDSSRRRMKALRTRDTLPELLIRRELFRRGWRFRVDRRIDPTVRVRADILFPTRKVAVFVDGCFWHCCPIHSSWPKANSRWWKAKLEANTLRDRRANEALQALGWTVVRVWEHEDASSAADAVEAVLRRETRG